MGREVKRVSIDFDWPLSKVWSGFLMPDRLTEDVCTGCVQPSPFSNGEPRGDGYSSHARHLRKLWYGHIPFKPEDNGSVPFAFDHPAVWERAQRNVQRAPEFYGYGRAPIVKEARRLATIFNECWSHHLNHADIVSLIVAERLRDFTHDYDPNREPRYQAIDPPVIPLPEEVNVWSFSTMGHDSINAHIVIKARCEREGYDDQCSVCDGHSTVEAYPGQRAEAEAWEHTEPPTGDGWQLWETVSEGSPISPVFATAEELAVWLTTPDACWGAMKRPMTISQARGFVGAGWAPSGMMDAGGMHDGATYVGTKVALSGHEED